ncbi:MAG: ParA family protein [Pedobacter sp.]|nr:MAG: ParA family protein [Pedobacter sp.]
MKQKKQSKVISISNHKGGVGKTTSAINIGAGLNKLGKKVLLVDLDAQANLSQSFGLKEQPKNIYGALRGDYVLEPITVIHDLDIIPSTRNLRTIEAELSTGAGAEFVLKEIIDPLIGQYDYILLDTPPSLGLLTINAFVASKMALIPLQSEYLALQGLESLLDISSQIKRRLNPTFKIGGIFLTRYDQRKMLNRSIFDSISDSFSTPVFKTKIRENISLAEAPTNELDIFRYEPKSNGAEDYLNLSNEILKLI